jgi:predicted lipid-binding transport protein (Tim44 family)
MGATAGIAYPRPRQVLGRTRVHYKHRVIGAALGFLIGVGLLLAGLVINVILVAVAGFVVMLACSLWAVTSYRLMTAITTGQAPAQVRQVGKKRRGQGPAARQAGGIWADGAAGGALAAWPAARPLTRFH